MEQVEIYIERLHKPQTGFRPDNKTNKARILMLHGHGQSGWFFYHKTKFLIKTLQMMASERNKKGFANGIELFYPNGPLQASQNLDPDVWAWGRGDVEGGLIDGLSETLKKIMDILHTYGPFVGVIGFSTGAAIAAITASLLERGGDHALNTQVNSPS
ncbi:serine hydrolase-domain-containing protein [Aspergillus pseudoustus]|uniref:Serine hydrolase-domain-containing protein n=1 Tax=Aspergillus pseudoustus TaxID=1810923 RepID=A0ABR4K4L1_9EURO